MRKIKMQKLSVERFAQYGAFADMVNPGGFVIGKAPVEFYRDMLQLGLGQTNAASFSVCKVRQRPLVIDCLEYHNHTGEAMMPLDGDALLYFAPASKGSDIPYESIEAFYVPKGTMAVIRPGVWHCGAFAWKADCVNVMVVLPERVYANDCIVVPIPPDDCLEIVE